MNPFLLCLQIWWKYKIIVLLELINAITSCQQEYLMVETEMLLILNSIMVPVSKIVTTTSEYKHRHLRQQVILCWPVVLTA